jgi:hypothetical protein
MGPKKKPNSGFKCGLLEIGKRDQITFEKIHQAKKANKTRSFTFMSQTTVIKLIAFYR